MKRSLAITTALVLMLAMPPAAFAQGGARGGGGGRGGGGFYTGSTGYINGLRSADQSEVLKFLLLGAIPLGIVWLTSAAYRRHRWIKIGILLRRGGEYGKYLDDAVRLARFGGKSGRREFMRALAARVDPVDVVVSSFQVIDTSTKSAGNMNGQWPLLKKQLGPNLRLMNDADDIGTNVNRLSEIEPVPVDSDSYCFIGLICLRHVSAVEPMRESLTRGRLEIPIYTWRDHYDAIYVLYTPRDPETDEPLGEVVGRDLVSKMDDTVRVRHSTRSWRFGGDYRSKK